MARWQFGPGGGNCCDDNCTIFDEGIQATYTGFAFDDDWLIYNDISQENMDLTAVSGGAVILNKNDAAYNEAVVEYTITGTSTMPNAQTLRFIICADDNVASAADYLYADLSIDSGELQIQLGYRDTDADNNVGTAVKLTGKSDLNGVWRVCYNGTQLRVVLDQIGRAAEDITLPSNAGTRFGLESSDWSDYDVTPLPMGAVYYQHQKDNDELYSRCPWCVPPALPECPCGQLEFMQVGLKSGNYLLPFVSSEDIGLSGITCTYQDTFNIASCQTCDGFGNVTNAAKLRIVLVISRADPFTAPTGTLSVTYVTAGDVDIITRELATGTVSPYNSACGNYYLGPDLSLFFFAPCFETECDRAHFNTAVFSFPGRIIAEITSIL